MIIILRELHKVYQQLRTQSVLPKLNKSPHLQVLYGHVYPIGQWFDLQRSNHLLLTKHYDSPVLRFPRQITQ